MFGDERFDEIRYRILDLTDVCKFEINRNDVASFTAHSYALRKSNAFLKLAIVADNDKLKAMAEIYKKQNAETSWEIEIFSSLAHAREWIA